MRASLACMLQWVNSLARFLIGGVIVSFFAVLG